MSTSTNQRQVGAGIERRYWGSLESKPGLFHRATENGPSPVIVGYAAVFYRADDPGTEYSLWQDAYERVLPGAFDAAIREGDLVRGLTNHDPNWLLGRSDRGSVRLSVDAVGLRYEIDPPDTQAGRDTLALLQRGDLDGSSFGFRAYGGKRGKVRWVDETRDGRQIEVRELVEVELLDVGPVTFPAYSSSTAGARAADLPSHLAEAAADWERRHAGESAVDLTALELEMRIRTVTELIGPEWAGL